MSHQSAVLPAYACTQSSGLRPQFFLRGADVAGGGRGKDKDGGLSAPVPEEAIEALEVGA